MNPITVIPARLAATRLPGKPLLDIAGTPLILHVWRRAIEADCGPVLVATDHPSIADLVIEAGGQAVLTSEAHPSGTDRIAEALATFDPDATHDTVLNLQGDLPDLPPAVARATLDLLQNPEIDLATAACLLPATADPAAPNAVKLVGSPLTPTRLRALYFTRAPAPWGPGPHYEHIGLYAWRRAALTRFVRLPPSVLELRERLEQLRALEAGMRIDAVLVPETPIGVDTPHDLAAARARLARAP